MSDNSNIIICRLVSASASVPEGSKTGKCSGCSEDVILSSGAQLLLSRDMPDSKIVCDICFGKMDTTVVHKLKKGTAKASGKAAGPADKAALGCIHKVLRYNFSDAAVPKLKLTPTAPESNPTPTPAATPDSKEPEATFSIAVCKLATAVVLDTSVHSKGYCEKCRRGIIRDKKLVEARDKQEIKFVCLECSTDFVVEQSKNGLKPVVHNATPAAVTPPAPPVAPADGAAQVSL